MKQNRLEKSNNSVNNIDLYYIRDMVNQNFSWVEKFKKDFKIYTPEELQEMGMEEISSSLNSGEDIEEVLNFADCPIDFRGEYLNPEIFKHLYNKIFNNIDGGNYYKFINSYPNFREDSFHDFLVLMHDYSSRYFINIEHVTHLGIRVNRAVNIKEFFNHIENHWLLLKKLDLLLNGEFMDEEEYNKSMNLISGCSFNYLIGKDLLNIEDYAEINIKIYYNPLNIATTEDKNYYNKFIKFIKPYTNKYLDFFDQLTDQTFKELYPQIIYFTDINITKRKQCILFTKESTIKIEEFRNIILDPDILDYDLHLVERFTGDFLKNDTRAANTFLQVKDYTSEVQMEFRQNISIRGFGIIKFGKTVELEPKR